MINRALGLLFTLVVTIAATSTLDAAQGAPAGAGGSKVIYNYTLRAADGQTVSHDSAVHSWPADSTTHITSRCDYLEGSNADVAVTWTDRSGVGHYAGEWISYHQLWGGPGDNHYFPDQPKTSPSALQQWSYEANTSCDWLHIWVTVPTGP